MKRLCRAGWHSWTFVEEPPPDMDFVRRCRHCLKRRRDFGMPVTKWLSARGLPRIHGCIWDAECRYWSCPLRIALMWGKFEGKHGTLWADLPDYMFNPFEGRRTWSWGCVVFELSDGRKSRVRWSLPLWFTRRCEPPKGFEHSS